MIFDAALLYGVVNGECVDSGCCCCWLVNNNNKKKKKKKKKKNFISIALFHVKHVQLR